MHLSCQSLPMAVFPRHFMERLLAAVDCSEPQQWHSLTSLFRAAIHSVQIPYLFSTMTLLRQTSFLNLWLAAHRKAFLFASRNLLMLTSGDLVDPSYLPYHISEMPAASQVMLKPHLTFL